MAALEERASAAQRQAEELAETLPPLREAAAAAGARLQRLRLAHEQLGAEERRLQDARVQLDQRLRQLKEDRLREQARADDTAATVERLCGPNWMICFWRLRARAKLRPLRLNGLLCWRKPLRTWMPKCHR